MQTSSGPQAYLRTKVMTASPAELRLMLIDGAIRFAEQTKRGYETRNFEMSFDSTTKTQAILMELINALRPEQAPELCHRLTALYTYLYRLLVEASSERDVSKVDEVLTRLRFERETWSMCIGELAKENRSASSMQELPTVTPTTSDSKENRARVSITG
jgi:flagellar protein FliS